MKVLKSYVLLFLLVLISSCDDGFENDVINEEITVNEITDVVEILRDQWGVNHIYAQNQYDLFFSQGYLAAKDRLFQFCFELEAHKLDHILFSLISPQHPFY